MSNDSVLTTVVPKVVVRKPAFLSNPFQALTAGSFVAGDSRLLLSPASTTSCLGPRPSARWGEAPFRLLRRIVPWRDGTSAFLECYAQSSLQSLEKFQDGSGRRFDQGLHSGGVPDRNGYACLMDIDANIRPAARVLEGVRRSALRAPETDYSPRPEAGQSPGDYR